VDTPVEQMTDEAIAAAVSVEKELYGELIDRYEAKLRRYITRLGVRNPDDQLDVLQDIFLKTYRNINGFDSKLKFSSWIYRIAHNEAVSWYRKRNVRPEGHMVGDSEELIRFMAGDVDSADVVFDEKVNAEVINSALLKIDDKYRQVLLLRFFEHKDYEEISDILKIPVGSVGTLIHRGKKQLARVINSDSIRM
jgi:RNA polymerase sigma-70 factor (ECF subfamily)